MRISDWSSDVCSSDLFAASPALRTLSSRGRTRLDQVVPALLHATGASSDPHTALPRLHSLIGALVRRSSYLALLDEATTALARLVRSEERSVGHEWVSPCQSRWSPPL